MAQSYDRRINMYINVDGKQVVNNVRSIRSELAKIIRDQNQMDIGSEEYQKQTAKIKQLKGILADHSKELGNVKKPMQGLIDTAKGLLPAFGAAALAGGVKMAFDKIVASTDVLSTKWAVFTGGLKSGLNEFWRTMATGEWSGFIDNMRTAISVGREYETTLDNIEEKTRALRIKEAEARKTELDLEIKLKNQTLSKTERLEAGQQRIQLEEDLSKERVKVAQDAFDAELKVTMQQTRLGKDRLMEVVSDMDSETKIKAQAYNEQLSIYESAQIKEQQAKAGLSRAGITVNPYSEEVAKSKAILDSYPDSVRIYAEALRGVGKTTDEQLDKMVSGYEGLLAAQNSAAENTKKVRTMVNSLLAGQDEEPGGSTAEALKKKQEDAKKLSEKMNEFLMKDAEAQKYAIKKYFLDAGEGAFDEFMKAIEAKQNENSIDLTILPEAKPEEEKKDPSLDYAIQQYQETLDFKLLLNENMYQNGLIGEQEYQDKLTELTRAGEEKRFALRAESIEKAKQFAEFGANFVTALMDLELAKAGENEEKKAAIRKKYARIQFLVSASQIIVDTASAIMKALAQLGPIAGAIAAGIIGTTGAVQLGVAYAQMDALDAHKAGGYTSGSGVYVAAEAGQEWIAPHSFLQDPYTASIIAGLEDMRRNPVSVRSSAIEVSKSFSNTGSTRTYNYNQTSVPFPSNDAYNESLKIDIKGLNNAINMNSRAIALLMKDGVRLDIVTIKKQLDIYDYIINHTGLFGK